MLQQVLGLIIFIELFILLSLSLNLIVGYTGLLSLCHAAFYAVGAYTTAILTVNYNVSLWIALPLSGIFAAITGVLIGLPTLRLKGDYLAIATLGFGEIVKNVILNFDSLTRGPMGIHGIKPPVIFGYSFNPYTVKIDYILLFFLFIAGTYLFLNRIIKSRFGRALEAIREDEIAAGAMGINTTKYKIYSFSIGAFFAGIAGSLFASYLLIVSPGDFNFMLSIMVLCMVVLGGMGNHLAVILGAAALYAASELPRLTGLSSVIPPQVSQIIFGLILVIMMIFRPQGILGRKKNNFEAIITKFLNKKEAE